MSSAIYMLSSNRSTTGDEKMAQAKFLIAGATGATGGYTVRQLLAKKQAVRVLAHRVDDRSMKLRELGDEACWGTSSTSMQYARRPGELAMMRTRRALKGVRHDRYDRVASRWRHGVPVVEAYGVVV
jgi:nucleoside-diphosphate-sugar epimerase